MVSPLHASLISAPTVPNPSVTYGIPQDLVQVPFLFLIYIFPLIYIFLPQSHYSFSLLCGFHPALPLHHSPPSYLSWTSVWFLLNFLKLPQGCINFCAEVHATWICNNDLQFWFSLNFLFWHSNQNIDIALFYFVTGQRLPRMLSCCPRSHNAELHATWLCNKSFFKCLCVTACKNSQNQRHKDGAGWGDLSLDRSHSLLNVLLTFEICCLGSSYQSSKLLYGVEGG